MLRTILKLASKGSASSRYTRFVPSTRSRKRTTPHSKTITGVARVIDGDSIELKGYNIRMEGIDAPELGQPAKHVDGRRFDHGALVKNALQQRIGGKHVTVRVSGTDKYRRVLGAVYLGDEDINAWLVRNGHAISAYGQQYKRQESAARRQKRGQWSFAEKYEPQYWRNQNRKGGRRFSRSPASGYANRLVRKAARRQISKLWRL